MESHQLPIWSGDSALTQLVEFRGRRAHVSGRASLQILLHPVLFSHSFISVHIEHIAATPRRTQTHGLSFTSGNES